MVENDFSLRFRHFSKTMDKKKFIGQAIHSYYELAFAIKMLNFVFINNSITILISYVHRLNY